MLPDTLAKPWLRACTKLASGGDPTGDYNTFHNSMPTNHPYYGFADQLAFQNLMDVLELNFPSEPDVQFGCLQLHIRYWIRIGRPGQGRRICRRREP